MKFHGIHGDANAVRLHSMRGAWIEIVDERFTLDFIESHSMRGAWIEMFDQIEADKEYTSHPMRGAWIKIRACCQIASISMGGRRNSGGRSSRLPSKRFLTSNRSLPPKGRSTSRMCRRSASIRRWGSRRNSERRRTSRAGLILFYI